MLQIDGSGSFSGSIQAQRFDPEDAVEFWDMVNKQDWHVCELILTPV
jgi:hypothetical protein